VTEYVYLGAARATYPQYLAVSASGDTTLTADPGEAYDIRPAPGYEDKKGASVLPVPPGDGLWAEAPAEAKTPPAAKRKGA
jgi:hypothetical protein